MAISENSVPLFYATIDKVAEDDKWEFEVVASTDALDKDGEIVDPAAIRKMKSVERVPYCVASDHREARINPLTQVGWAYPIPDTPDNVFKARVELWTDYPRAKEYWTVLRKTWQEQKVSIGGELAKPKTIEWHDGRRVRRIHDIELDHILAVRGPAAANPETAVELDMRKALFKTADELYGDTDKEWHGLSAEEIRDALKEKVAAELPNVEYVWVVQLYEDSAVVSVDIEGGGPKHYLVSYSVGEDGTVRLGDIKPVRQVWVDDNGYPVGAAKSEEIEEMPEKAEDAADMWDELEEAAELLEEGKEFVDFDDDVVEKASIEVSTKPWRKVGYAKKLPASCFLYVPDPKKRSTWKFPVFEGADYDPKTGRYRKRGKLNWNALRNAAARLAAIINRVKQGRGFKGMSLAEAKRMIAVVKKKIAALYRRIGKPVPEVLAKTVEMGDERMTLLERFLSVVSDLMGKSEGEAASEEIIEEAAAAVNEEQPAEDEAQEDKTGDEAEEAAPDYEARFKALEEQLAAMRELIEQMAGNEDKTEESESGDEEQPAEEAPAEENAEESEAEKSEDTSAEDIAEALREALKPIVARIDDLQKSVETVAKARGVSLQIDKAEPQADDASDEGGSLMDWELALRKLADR